MLIVAVATVVALALVSYFVFFAPGGSSAEAPPSSATTGEPAIPTPVPTPTPDPTTTPTPTLTGQTEEDQATGLEALIETSAAGRTLIAKTSGKIKCHAPSSVVSDLTDARDNRRGLLRSLAHTDLSAMTKGQELRQHMSSYLTHSANYDSSAIRYINTCASSDESRISTESAQASSEKKKFLEVWNPLADEYGLTQYEEGEI